MSKCVILVDNSNVFIAGRHLAAKKSGMCTNGKHSRECDVNDTHWRINFGGLIKTLSKGRIVAHALLVGSRPPFADAVWKAAEDEGFEVIVHDRNHEGKEKAIDTELVARGTEIVVESQTPGTLIVVSGDLDLLPLLHVAKERGWRVELAAFQSTCHKDSELCNTADEVRMLDEVFEEIGMMTDESDRAA